MRTGFAESIKRGSQICARLEKEAKARKEIGKIGECVAGTVAEVADLRNIKKEPSESLNRISPLLILSGQETEAARWHTQHVNALALKSPDDGKLDSESPCNEFAHTVIPIHT